MPLPLPFLGGAYEGRSKSVNAERCLNFYLEKQGGQWILVGTPGLTLRATVGIGPIRGLYLFGSNLIAVSGNEVYAITSAHVGTLLGTIGTFSGAVSMSDNGADVLIVDGSASGYYTDGATLTTIADADFDGGTAAAFIDGYFLVSNPGAGTFQLSELNSVTSWLSTDVATAEGLPDDLRGLIADYREAWLAGVKSTEVWVNTGDPDFPFARKQFIEKGIAAGATLRKHDNSLIWLSEDDRGHGLVVSVGGEYQPQIVSPVGINWQIAQFSQISDAFGFTYQIEGHEFYVLTFPTGNRTFVYDAATKQWHQWSSNLDGDALSRHRANCHAFAFGRHYVGDYASGKIYSVESNVYTEDGAAIIRDRIGQHLNAEDQRIPIASVEISFEEGVGLASGQGSDPQALLRWSKNSGRTWSNELWRSAGKIGEYGTRAVWRKPGRSRDWTFWLRVSDPVKWIVRAATMTLRGEDREKKDR